MLQEDFYNGFFTYKLPNDIISEIRKHENVIIYGAGKVGIGLLELLTQYNINIKAFAQTDLRNNENENISGIPLKGIDEIINDEDDILLVASKELFGVNDGYCKTNGI